MQKLVIKSDYKNRNRNAVFKFIVGNTHVNNFHHYAQPK